MKSALDVVNRRLKEQEAQIQKVSARLDVRRYAAQIAASAIITPSLPYSITSIISDALMLARAIPDPILITGSLHFVGEVLAHLRGEPAAFEECAQ